MSKFLVCFVFLVKIVLLNGNNFEISKINSKGVVFENIGRAHFYNTKWNIVTSVRFPDNNKVKEFLKLCKFNGNKVCKSLEELNITSNCNKFTSEIDHITHTLEIQSAELDNYFRYRNKRSPFDGVGTFTKKLFGTMDNNDATIIYKHLDKLEADNAGTFDLLKQQVSLVSNNINHTSQAINNLNRNQLILLEKINHLQERLTRYPYDSINKLAIQINANEIFSLLTLKLMELRNERDMFISIINQLVNHKLHPLIIDNEKIYSIILKNSHNMNSDEALLVPFIFHQTLSIKYVFFNHQAFIKIAIPIPNKIEYDLTQAYLIPFKVAHNIYSVYNIDNNILASNLVKKQFIMVNKDEYNKCIDVAVTKSKDLKFCRLTQLIMKDFEQNCFTHLYFNPYHKNITVCDHITIKFNNNPIIMLLNCQIQIHG